MSTSDLTSDDRSQTEDNRARILSAAVALIEQGGREAATTRAVAAAAGVQAPTIYRLFGDKQGLLDAVALHRLEAYVAEKSSRPSNPDPVQDLRDGWDDHVAFGLANPGVFAILSGDPQPGPTSQPVAAGYDVLRRRVKNIALAGRLRISEKMAVDLLRSAGTGTVQTLLSQPEKSRDPGLSIVAREAVISAMTGVAVSSPTSGATGAAVALRASLDDVSALSDGERHLLTELLDRIARTSYRSG